MSDKPPPNRFLMFLAMSAFLWSPVMAAQGLDAIAPNMGYLAYGLWLAWLAYIAAESA